MTGLLPPRNVLSRFHHSNFAIYIPTQKLKFNQLSEPIGKGYGAIFYLVTISFRTTMPIYYMRSSEIWPIVKCKYVVGC